MNENEVGILQSGDRSGVAAMCGVQRKNRKRSKSMILMLGLNERIDHLAMANSVRYYCC